ncbi:MAG: thiamine-phosphate kinase [Actinomycetes bacterium]
MTAPSQPTLAEAGEFGLIAALTADLPIEPAVLVGPGDDAAVVKVDGPVVTSVDLLVEGVHFRRDWCSGADVGRKAVAVNVADLEAMGARATALVVGFCAPPDLPEAWALDLAAGLRAECAAAGVAWVGGDVTRGRDITIAVTVFGSLEGRAPVRRRGAVAGQVLALRGRLGWAAAGHRVLGRGFRSPRAVVEAYRVPQVPSGEGAVAAAAGATAMIDISDGLVADLGHVAVASGVDLRVETAAFEVPEPLRAVAAATGTSPYDLVLTGGEDHALAATFADADAVPDGWRVVGRVEACAPGSGPAVWVDDARAEGAGGWDHFGGGR